MIEARNVGLSFGDVAALTRVSLMIPPRGLTAVVGPSGSGKSSLLYVLSGLRQATSGEVLLDGRPLRAHDQALLRREKFAFIFQHHYLVMYLSAFENALTSIERPTRQDRENATELLRTLGLGSRLEHQARKLSGGERQRVAVARGLSRSAEYIFADEPTAALDRTSARVIYRLLRDAANTRAVILVTHDPEGISVADRVVALGDGRLVPASRHFAPAPMRHVPAT